MTTKIRTKIIIDNKIPFIKGCLEPFFEVEYLPATDFTPSTIHDATALVVRTTVKCNQALLEQSDVRLIATATIGFDHIDTLYCSQKGIRWQNAPGCNATSVAQYISTVLCWLHKKERFDYHGKTIGLIGYGNVGQKVGKICALLGLKVIAYDPLIALSNDLSTDSTVRLTSLEELQAKADILSFHTPLTDKSNSDFPTLRIADDRFFERLSQRPLIINSARGGVVDERALLRALDRNQVCGAVIDCWENEPHIDRELLEKAWVATPHIAGYSADGKHNGTLQTVAAVADFFSIKTPELCFPLPQVSDNRIDLGKISEEREIEEAILRTYPFFETEMEELRNEPAEFRSYRDNYRLRREAVGYHIINDSGMNRKLLSQIGFNLE